jgi:arsenate reductase
VTSRKKQNVLFLCAGNACRSQMGEAFLRKHGGDLFDVYSAGLEPTGQVHPMTIRALEEKGLDASGHRSKPAKEEALAKLREIRDAIRRNYTE